MPNSFVGSWKSAGFVVSVPLTLRPQVKAVEVKSAKAAIVEINPHLFHVVIPKGVPNASDWEVYFKNGRLIVRPPNVEQPGIKVSNVASGNAQVGMMVGVVRGSYRGGRIIPPSLPTIGLVLPRQGIRVVEC